MSSLACVSAEIVAEAPTFWEKISAFFRSATTFTIVGQDTQADEWNYCRTGQICYTYQGHNLGRWDVQPGELFVRYDADTQAMCNGHSGLYHIWKIQGTSRVPFYEGIDYVEFRCGTYNTRCEVELYCMPYDYPPTDSICNSWKSGYEKVSNYDKPDDAYIQDPIMPLYDFGNQVQILEYFYCAAPQSCEEQSKPDINCYGKNGQGGCDHRIYDCTYTTYPSCPTTYPYTSLGACTGAITTLDKTCAQNGGHWFYPAVQTCSGSLIPSKDTTTNCCSVTPTDISNGKANGERCSTNSECASNRCWRDSVLSNYICAPAEGSCTCKSTCAAGEGEIAAPGYCAGSSLKCCSPSTTKKANGERCAADAECISDYCKDGGLFAYDKCADVPEEEQNTTAPDNWQGVPMTQAAYDSAEAGALLDSWCTLPRQCSKEEEDIILGDEETLENFNWTITCKKSNNIKSDNFEALKEYTLQQHGRSWSSICGGGSVVGLLGKVFAWFAGRDTCAQVEANIPSGTCRATPKTVNTGGFCVPAINNFLSPYTKVYDCQTNTIIAIILLIVLIFATMRLAG